MTKLNNSNYAKTQKLKNMKFCKLEQVKSHDPLYAIDREKLLFRKFNKED